jgi:hypothetical protein
MAKGIAQTKIKTFFGESKEYQAVLLTNGNTPFPLLLAKNCSPLINASK